MDLKGDGYFELSIKDSNGRGIENVGFTAKRKTSESRRLGPNSVELHSFKNVDENAESISITAVLEEQSFEVKLK